MTLPSPTPPSHHHLNLIPNCKFNPPLRNLLPLPPQNQYQNNQTQYQNQVQPKSLPDIFLAALSFLFLISKPKPKPKPKHNPLCKNTQLVSFRISVPPPPPRPLLLNTTAMSQSNPKPNSTRVFASPQSLSDWLRPRLPPDSFASWGVRPGTKNVHNLWLEIYQGETSLADSTPPIRTLHVAAVRIVRQLGHRNRTLLESHQELSDGTVRQRCRPLSEKMRPGETPESAAIRAVQEELGSVLSKPDQISGSVRIVPGSYRRRVEERISVSYPGLPACYVLHDLDAWVDGLPDVDFCTHEDGEYGDCVDLGIANQAVSVKRHYWKWVDSDISV